MFQLNFGDKKERRAEIVGLPMLGRPRTTFNYSPRRSKRSRKAVMEDSDTEEWQEEWQEWYHEQPWNSGVQTMNRILHDDA